MATPSLGGFALVEAFPGTKLDIPSALVWPKVDGVAPFLLERTARLFELGSGTPGRVLDLSPKVALMGEGGALGMALLLTRQDDRRDVGG